MTDPGVQVKKVPSFTERLDDAMRQWDRRANRTVGGMLDQWCGIDRHTLPALLLPAILCGLLVLGSPSLGRLGFALVCAAVVGAVLVRMMRRSAKENRSIGRDVATQAAAVLAVVAVIALGGGDQAEGHRPYRHLFLALAAVTSIALLVAAASVDRLFGWLRDTSCYGAYLKRTELFASRGGREPSNWPITLLSAATFAILSPLALLMLPALAIVLVPPYWVSWATWIAGGASLLALLVSGANERFGTMWLVTQDVFFRGGALLVSLGVIALAGMRWAGVSYVTTMLDSAAWWTIVVVLLTAYVLCWWFDYWTHRLLLDQVLRLIDRDAGGRAFTGYAIDQDAVATSVPQGSRSLEIYGSTRLLAFNPTGERKPYFQAHRPMELIQLLATSGAPGGKAKPTPGQVVSRVSAFYALAGMVVVLLLASGARLLHGGVQSPAVELVSTKDGKSMADLLKADGDQEVIVLAASGGGTRAALYTASVLEGLATKGLLNRVVVGSGVSGGGAALAYFAGHRESLIANKEGAWQTYFDRMSDPYIQDVLEHATEWRMVSSGRLGSALADSFQARWALPADRQTLLQVQDFGLIFNTSLAGHFDRPASAPAGKPLHKVEPPFRDALTSSKLSGGRLLLTNLKLQEPLVSDRLEPDRVLRRLPVVIRSADLHLWEAAALNANFPPVFSNAAIDVDEATRYWVTDGGAVDNRGLEMLLFALLRESKTMAGRPLPRIHVIVADASAFSSTYAQDRGLSTVVGAGARFASHLNAELVQDIRQFYGAEAGRFRLSYVMMPDLLREAGSFGTHWMLQGRILVRHNGDRLTISGKEAIDVIRSLHAPAAVSRLSDDGCKVLRWSLEDGGHREGWQAVTGDAPSTAKPCQAP